MQEDPVASIQQTRQPVQTKKPREKQKQTKQVIDIIIKETKPKKICIGCGLKLRKQSEPKRKN